MRSAISRVRAMGSAAAVIGVVALGAPASAAATDFTWTGATPSGAGATNWSQPANWQGGVAPSGSVGALSFPSLSSNSACTGSPTEACYTSNNDGSISATSLSIDDNAGYNITGNEITLGSGGLSASTTISPANGAFQSQFRPDITLGASQTWSADGQAPGGAFGVGQLQVYGNVTGPPTDTLTLALSNFSNLFLAGDDEVGPVTVSGANTSLSGSFASQNGLLDVGNKLNSGDGQTVTLQHAGLNQVGPATVGPLSSTGGVIELGDSSPPSPSGSLTVVGSATLDSASALTTTIQQAGTTAGTDYGQLTVDGSVAIGGSLTVFLGSQCPTLTTSDVYTLVTASAALTGTFSNAPDGSTIQTTGGCPTNYSLQIHYTSDSVTATVTGAVGGSTLTTTSLTPNPTSSATNQPVTLTATVHASSGTTTPTGTVEFLNKGSAIAGCTARPLSGSGTTARATCRTSFAAATSPESLTAVYTPSGGSGFQGSQTTHALQFLVHKDPTTTALTVSSSTPKVHESVTFTAVVIPRNHGPIVPSGQVLFVDNGSVIRACGARPLSHSRATCTVSYTAPGTHSITARYEGNVNFSASVSAKRTVTVSK